MTGTGQPGPAPRSFQGPDPSLQNRSNAPYPGEPDPSVDERELRPRSASPAVPERSRRSRFSTFTRRAAIAAALEDQRQANEGARKRMEEDYPVVAELITNVPTADQYTLLTISDCLSNLYNRSQSCITVSIRHSALLLHGHSFDPAYILTISTHPALCPYDDNDNHSALLARCLDETLAVAPRQGSIRYLPVQESHFAISGRTMLGMYKEEVRAELAIAAARREAQESGRRRSMPGVLGLGLWKSRYKGKGPEVQERGGGRMVLESETDKDEEEGYGGQGTGSGSRRQDNGRRPAGARKSLSSVWFGRGSDS